MQRRRRLVAASSFCQAPNQDPSPHPRPQKLRRFWKSTQREPPQVRELHMHVNANSHIDLVIHDVPCSILSAKTIWFAPNSPRLRFLEDDEALGTSPASASTVLSCVDNSSSSQSSAPFEAAAPRSAMLPSSSFSLSIFCKRINKGQEEVQSWIMQRHAFCPARRIVRI